MWQKLIQIIQIRKASNIDITKLQIIITNVKYKILQKINTNVGATNEQTNENKTNKATNYYMILIIII